VFNRLRTYENMKKLIDLKNIFAKQLPKMPKEYIVKLVFNRYHEAMIILKNNKKVIGGICFRIFEGQKFAEIVFLAITSQQQVKGFGTRLMNKFKEEMQKRGIEFLATFADNYAIGKQRSTGRVSHLSRVLQEVGLLQGDHTSPHGIYCVYPF